MIKMSHAQCLKSFDTETSNNSNTVGTLNQSADVSYQQWQMQDVINTVDELIIALRR